jgi:hypothetical protein
MTERGTIPGYDDCKSQSDEVRMFLLRHPLIRLCVSNAAAGTLAALVVVAGLLAADAHGLRTLVAAEPGGWVAVALLTFGFVVTLGSVAIGAALMLLPHQGRSGHGGLFTPALVPVRVKARRRR